MLTGSFNGLKGIFLPKMGCTWHNFTRWNRKNRWGEPGQKGSAHEVTPFLVFTQICLHVWKTLLAFTPKARAFARSSGLSVSALIAEKTTATATVIATADKLSSGSAHESHRHKHGAENERDHDDRPTPS